MIDPPSSNEPGPEELTSPCWEYRVLVADDDAQCRGSLVSLLALDGFQIFPAQCGEEALRHIRAVQPHVEDRIHFMVLDYNMPDLTGLEVLRRVRGNLGLLLPAIVVTGEFSSDLERSVIAEGGFALVPKPIQPRPFRQIVQNLVRQEL